MNAPSGQRSIAELFGTFAKALQASCPHSLPGCGLYGHVKALPVAICTQSAGWGWGRNNSQTYFTISVPCEDCSLQLHLLLHPGAGILLEKQASSSFLTDAQRQALDAALANKSPQTGTCPLHCHALPVQRHLLRRLCRQMYQPQKGLQSSCCAPVSMAFAPLPPTALLAIPLLHDFPDHTSYCDKPAAKMAIMGSMLDASTQIDCSYLQQIMTSLVHSIHGVLCSLTH